MFGISIPETHAHFQTQLGYEDEPHELASTQECMQHALEITYDSNVRLKATGR